MVTASEAPMLTYESIIGKQLPIKNRYENQYFLSRSFLAPTMTMPLRAFTGVLVGSLPEITLALWLVNLTTGLLLVFLQSIVENSSIKFNQKTGTLTGTGSFALLSPLPRLIRSSSLAETNKWLSGCSLEKMIFKLKKKQGSLEEVTYKNKGTARKEYRWWLRANSRQTPNQATTYIMHQLPAS